MNSRKVTILAVVLAATAAITTVSSSTLSTQGKTPRVAVVNIREIFQNNKLNAEFDKKLETETSNARSEMRTISDEIEKLKADMTKFDSKSAKYMEIVKAGLEKQALLEARREFFQQYIDAKRQEFTETIYQRISDIVKKYAEANGIDMVLVQDDIRFPAASTSDLMLAMSTRKVLFASKDMDITPAVLAALNATAVK